MAFHLISLYHKIFCIYHDKLDFMRQLSNYLRSAHCETSALSQITIQSQNILKQKHYVVFLFVLLKAMEQLKFEILKNYPCIRSAEGLEYAKALANFCQLKVIRKLLKYAQRHYSLGVGLHSNGRAHGKSSMHTKPSKKLTLCGQINQATATAPTNMRQMRH